MFRPVRGGDDSVTVGWDRREGESEGVEETPLHQPCGSPCCCPPTSHLRRETSGAHRSKQLQQDASVSNCKLHHKHSTMVV